MNEPETPRPLSEAATAYYGWLMQRLQTGTIISQWQSVDGTLLATLAELLETQEKLAEHLQTEPLQPTYLKLRLQLAAQLASYSRMLGLCPKHREQQPKKPTDERLQQIAEELGLDPQLLGL
jgi:hypothetical protein